MTVPPPAAAAGPDPRPIDRHFGMDWLRIGAFALLILYHVAMVFAPWAYHAKSRHQASDAAMLPMLAVNAWRLTLLFVVSGYATRALLGRAHGVRAFLANRTARLLVPLAFGVAVIVPPQAWVELVTQHGYRGGYLTFWTRDWLSFSSIGGVVVPSWNHLWFVGYLWLYTVVLALAVVAIGPRRWQRRFDRAFGGIAVLLAPLAWYAMVHAWWYPLEAETHALVDDPMAHLEYVPAFLFGFGLARSADAMAAVVRWHRAAALVAVAGYGWVAAVQLGWVAYLGPWSRPYGFAHALQQWGAIVALVGFAERHWNRDAPLRPMLTEAVFPFYIVHQTIIVIVAWWLLGAGLSIVGESLVLAAATAIGCLAFYLGGRSIGWLRPLIGLRAG